MSDAYISAETHSHVTLLSLSNPPYNFINIELVTELLVTLQALDNDPGCRAIVLAAEGKVFCAGAEFGRGEQGPEAYIEFIRGLYGQAMQLYGLRKPIIAAVQGPAIGAGLGLALVADFRVSCEDARFSANFNRLGLHPGFGMSVTLPRLIGQNNAELLMYTGRRIKGSEAQRLGLINVLVEREEVKNAALELAQEIACSGPTAVQDTRATFRAGLADKVVEANKRELEIQMGHVRGAEFLEGVLASAERRLPNFKD